MGNLWLVRLCGASMSSPSWPSHGVHEVTCHARQLPYCQTRRLAEYGSPTFGLQTNRSYYLLHR